MKRTVLITGGAGFIGSSLADKLLNLGSKVIAIDNFNDFYTPEIKYENIKSAEKSPDFILHKADIEDQNALDSIFSKYKIDCVVHLAARAGVRPSLENPLKYAQTNILGTLNILECMKKYAVKHLVFASSSSVYGNCKAEKFSEDLIVSQPISPYAATKSAGEQFCYTYSKLYNIQTVCLRFFTVYGPRQRPDLAINKFISLIEQGKPIDMYGDGSSSRDYTYIDDITDGIIAAINYDLTPYEIINIGGGSPITLKQMIENIELLLGKKAQINQLPMQPGDVERTISDTRKAQSLLNYYPQTSFIQGLAKFIDWRKKHAA